MPKKRKTRKDKILLDQKRQTVHEVTSSIAPPQQKESPQTQQQTVVAPPMTFSLPTDSHKAPAPQKVKAETIAVLTSDYGYLGNDLVRTALLTGAIVFAELVIRLFFVH